MFKDRLVGVLDLESHRYDAFSEDDEQLLSTLAIAVGDVAGKGTAAARRRKSPFPGYRSGSWPEGTMSRCASSCARATSSCWLRTASRSSSTNRGEAFGAERLREILGLVAEGSAHEIADGLVAATDRFVGDGREPSDDRTVVVLKVAAG